MKHALGHVTFAICLLASLAFPPGAYSIETDKKSSGSGQVVKPDTGKASAAEGTTTGAIRGRSAPADERWEMKSNPALKTGTGRITVNVPGNGKMIFTVVPVGGRKHEKQLMSIYGSGAGNFKPGQYDVLLWDSRVTVPVEAGADTRVKVGILSTEGVAGPYKVYAAAGGGEVYSGSTAGRVVLPAGRYRVKTAGGAEGTVSIQDGEVTNFAKGGFAGAQTADAKAPPVKVEPTAPAGFSVTLDAANVAGGLAVTGTVTRSLPVVKVTPTTVKPMLINFSSSKPSVAWVSTPSSMAPGQTSSGFTVQTVPVAWSTGVDIAVSIGAETRTVAMTVLPPVLKSFHCAARGGVGDGGGIASVDCIVDLESPAPSGGLPVRVASSNPAVIQAGVIEVAHGQISSGFRSLKIFQVTSQTSITLTARANWGGKEWSSTVLVRPPGPPGQ